MIVKNRLNDVRGENFVSDLLRKHKPSWLAIHLPQLAKRLEAALDWHGSLFCDNCLLLRFQANFRVHQGHCGHHCWYNNSTFVWCIFSCGDNLQHQPGTDRCIKFCKDYFSKGKICWLFITMAVLTQQSFCLVSSAFKGHKGQSQYFFTGLISTRGALFLLELSHIFLSFFAFHPGKEWPHSSSFLSLKAYLIFVLSKELERKKECVNLDRVSFSIAGVDCG